MYGTFAWALDGSPDCAKAETRRIPHQKTLHNIYSLGLHEFPSRVNVHAAQDIGMVRVSYYHQFGDPLLLSQLDNFRNVRKSRLREAGVGFQYLQRPEIFHISYI